MGYGFPMDFYAPSSSDRIRALVRQQLQQAGPMENQGSQRSSQGVLGAIHGVFAIEKL